VLFRSVNQTLSSIETSFDPTDMQRILVEVRAEKHAGYVSITFITL
jgi:hypothetical protein